jgi:hypothetical protein
VGENSNGFTEILRTAGSSEVSAPWADDAAQEKPPSYLSGGSLMMEDSDSALVLEPSMLPLRRNRLLAKAVTGERPVELEFPVFAACVPFTFQPPRSFGLPETQTASDTTRLQARVSERVEASAVETLLSRPTGNTGQSEAAEPMVEPTASPAVAVRVGRRVPEGSPLANRSLPIRFGDEPSDSPTPLRTVVAHYNVAELPVGASEQAATPLPAPSRVARLEAVDRLEPLERTQRAEPVRSLSIEIRHADNDRVEVRLLQRSGELHVAVRATDAEVTQAMRQSLPELTGALEREGHRVEAWRPGGLASAAPAGSEAPRSGSEQPSGDPQPQGRWTQPDADQNRRHKQDMPRWVEDLEGALSEETGDSNGFSR